MPPTITKALPSIAFSKNKLELVINSADFRAAVPARAINKLTLTAPIPADGTITLTWATGNIVFTAKILPDDSGYQVPAGDSGNAYAQILLGYFQTNPLIDNSFEVSLDVTGPKPVFSFVALNYGTDYNFTAIVAATYTIVIAVPGVDAGTYPGFRHYIVINVRDKDGNWDTAYRFNVPLDTDTNGTTTLDISEVLHAYLALDIPSLTGPAWQACPNSLKAYQAKFAAFYGNPPAVRRVQTAPLSYITYGGYSKLALQQTGNDAGHLQKYLLPASSLYKFHRWFEAWPQDTFEVKTNQPQFLYFINCRSIIENYSIKLTLNYGDQTAELYLAGGSLKPFEKAAIACGYSQLGLQPYNSPGSLITGYSIQLVDSITHESRSLIKRFNVNREYEAYTRYFLYSDSAGNFKTLRTYGTSELSAEISADLVTLQTEVSQIPVTGNYRNTNISSAHNDKVNTGYISSAKEYDALIELHQAKQVFRVVGHALIPIVITSKNFDYSADGKPLNAGLLEYRLAYDDDLFTADSYALAVPRLNQSQQSINDI